MATTPEPLRFFWQAVVLCSLTSAAALAQAERTSATVQRPAPSGAEQTAGQAASSTATGAAPQADAAASASVAPVPFHEIRTHLEFLGYTVREVFAPGSGDANYLMGASHTRRANIILRIYRGGILLSAEFGCRPDAKDALAEKLEFANSFNGKASVARAYVESDGDIMVEAWYPRAYVREDFGVFIDNFQNDIDASVSSDLAQKIINSVR